MGRPRKPTILKEIEGNRGRRPLPTDEPVPIGGLPSCPDWMPETAAAEYVRLGTELARMGLATQVDRALLVAHCLAWADLQAAAEDIEARGHIVQGTKGERRNPNLTVKHQAIEVLLATSSRFGLSPADRTRIKVNGVDKPENKVKAFLGSG